MKDKDMLETKQVKQIIVTRIIEEQTVIDLLTKEGISGEVEEVTAILLASQEGHKWKQTDERYRVTGRKS